MVEFPEYVYDIKQRLRNPKVAGEILQYGAMLDDTLGYVLAIYFCAPGKHLDMVEIVMPNITFSTKIDILRSLPVRKTLKCRMRVISGLQRFKRIRNTVAHPFSANLSYIHRMCKDDRVRRMLLEYPDILIREFETTNQALTRLSKTKEWQNNCGDSPAPKPEDYWRDSIIRDFA